MRKRTERRLAASLATSRRRRMTSTRSRCWPSTSYRRSSSAIVRRVLVVGVQQRRGRWPPPRWQIAQRLLLDLRHPAQDVRALGVLGGPVGLAAAGSPRSRGSRRSGRTGSPGRRPPGGRCRGWPESSSRMRRQVLMAASRSPSSDTCRRAARVSSSAAVPRWLAGGLGRQLLVQRDQLLLAAQPGPPGARPRPAPGASPARWPGRAARWPARPRRRPQAGLLEAGDAGQQLGGAQALARLELRLQHARPAWPSRRCLRRAARGWWRCAGGARAAAGWPPAACAPRRPRAWRETTSSSRSRAREVCAQALVGQLGPAQGQRRRASCLPDQRAAGAPAARRGRSSARRRRSASPASGRPSDPGDRPR